MSDWKKVRVPRWLFTFLTWPHTPKNNLYPWWLVMWRMLVFLPVITVYTICRAIMWASILIFMGPNDAKRVWRDADFFC